MKTCRSCKRALQRDAFEPDNARVCAWCMELLAGGQKLCLRCEVVKELADFPASRAKSAGVDPVCKACKADEFKIRNADPEFRARRRASKLATRYGITVEQFDALLEQQGGVCAVCGGEPGAKGFHVDHCHETGRVRGLLCHGCNVLLGAARDDPRILKSAINYLE